MRCSLRTVSGATWTVRIDSMRRIAAACVTLCWMLSGAVLAVSLLRQASESTIPTTEYRRDVSSLQVTVRSPVRVIVPSVDIDAPIDPVGLDDLKRMHVPKRADRVGWYAPGVAPGQTGQAVLAAHVRGQFWTAGAFAALHEVAAGAFILIVDAQGTRHLFRVERADLFPGDTEDNAMVFGSFATTDAYLHLITCAGDWDGSEYSQRLVVTARAIASS